MWERAEPSLTFPKVYVSLLVVGHPPPPVNSNED